MRESLEMARKEDGRSFTVEQIEKSIARLEEKYKKLVDVPRDPGLAFESTGIDYVIVDEAHLYKNLAWSSPGLWCNARVIDRAGDGQADRARTGSSVSGSSPSSGTRDRRQRPRRSRPR